MSRETLQVHLGDLRSLKRLSKTTHSLADLLDGIIKIRRSVILPISRHLGLASLPSEIFLCIFSQFIGLFEDVFEGTRVLIRDLSLVSRHFRQMVIKCQKAWTYLDLNRLHSVENLDICMSRAKSGPLSVRYRHFAPHMSLFSCKPSHFTTDGAMPKSLFLLAFTTRSLMKISRIGASRRR